MGPQTSPIEDKPGSRECCRPTGSWHMDEMFGWISRGVEEHLVYKG